LKNIKLEISVTDQPKHLMKEFSKCIFKNLNTSILEYILVNGTYWNPGL